MHLRHDALAAAAEWIVEVEAYANLHDDLVATVGKIDSTPGAINVIPGEATASLDLRHHNDEFRKVAAASLLESAATIAAKRGVKVASKPLSEQAAVPMNPHLAHLLHTASARAGFPSRVMTSGAGHDAMIVAPHIPATMLFLRSPGGLSHHPDESVLPHDIEAALNTAMEFLTLLRDDRSNIKDDHA